MGFYFCGIYIYTEGDKKEAKWDMYAAPHIFGVLMIILDMRSRKAILKFSSVI